MTLMGGGDAFQTFYGVFRIIATGGAFLIQSTITSRLLERFGLKNIFFILPTVMLFAISAMIGIPGIAATAIGFAVVRLVRQTIEESGRKSMLALVPEERRGRVSLFMDSYLLGLGTILGCLVTGAVIFIGSRVGIENISLIYLGLAAVGAIFSLWAVTRMRKTYDSSLLNWRLKRRQRTSRVVDKLNLL